MCSLRDVLLPLLHAEELGTFICFVVVVVVVVVACEAVAPAHSHLPVQPPSATILSPWPQIVQHQFHGSTCVRANVVQHYRRSKQPFRTIQMPLHTTVRDWYSDQ